MTLSKKIRLLEGYLSSLDKQFQIEIKEYVVITEGKVVINDKYWSIFMRYHHSWENYCHKMGNHPPGDVLAAFRKHIHDKINLGRVGVYQGWVFNEIKHLCQIEMPLDIINQGYPKINPEQNHDNLIGAMVKSFIKWRFPWLTRRMKWDGFPMRVIIRLWYPELYKKYYGKIQINQGNPGKP